jgi:hypothetical protein
VTGSSQFVAPTTENGISPSPTSISTARAGFGGVSLSYIVFFPKFLAFLRGLEPRLGWCPLGAQTLTVGTR